MGQMARGFKLSKTSLSLWYRRPHTCTSKWTGSGYEFRKIPSSLLPVHLEFCQGLLYREEALLEPLGNRSLRWLFSLEELCQLINIRCYNCYFEGPSWGGSFPGKDRRRSIPPDFMATNTELVQCKICDLYFVLLPGPFPKHSEGCLNLKFRHLHTLIPDSRRLRRPTSTTHASDSLNISNGGDSHM